MTSTLCVTSTVDPSVLDDFNDWYQREHIPDARRLLQGVRKVTRWRSLTTPNQVTTVYEFESADEVHAALNGDGIKTLIAEFDRLWSGKVERDRSGSVQIYDSSRP